MPRFLSSCWHAVLEVLFPRCCSVCERKLLDDEQVICQDCLDAIPRTEHALLEQNGIDLLFLEQIHKESRTVRYERGAAFAYYNRGRGLCIRTLVEQGQKQEINRNPCDQPGSDAGFLHLHKHDPDQLR